MAERLTSWSPFSGLFAGSYTFSLLQLPTEVTGTHLLGGILGRLPEDTTGQDRTGEDIFLFLTHRCKRKNIRISESQHLQSFWPTDLYLILVWPGRSRLEYCLDNALKSPSPLPLPPLAGSNVGLAAVVIFDGSAVTTHERKTSNISWTTSHVYNYWHQDLRKVTGK